MTPALIQERSKRSIRDALTVPTRNRPFSEVVRRWPPRLRRRRSIGDDEDGMGVRRTETYRLKSPREERTPFSAVGKSILRTVLGFKNRTHTER